MDTSDDTARRGFLYFATAGAGAVVTRAEPRPLANQMNPSADVLALVQISVDISHLAHSTQCMFSWRGKPVFIRYRADTGNVQARG